MEAQQKIQITIPITSLIKKTQQERVGSERVGTRAQIVPFA